MAEFDQWTQYCKVSNILVKKSLHFNYVKKAYLVIVEITFDFCAQIVQLLRNDSMKYEIDLPCEQATQVPTTKDNLIICIIKQIILQNTNNIYLKYLNN